MDYVDPNGMVVGTPLLRTYVNLISLPCIPQLCCLMPTGLATTLYNDNGLTYEEVVRYLEKDFKLPESAHGVSHDGQPVLILSVDTSR